MRRWPTLLAVVSAFLIADAGTERLRSLLILLVLAYLVITVIGVRSATWPLLLGLTILLVALSLQDQVRMDAALVVAAAVTLVVGIVRRSPRRELAIQTGSVVVLVALSLAAASAEPPTATYLVAGGWLAHGIWDFVHIWRDKVVARSYAEWCGVLDVLVAGALIATV